MKALRVLLIFLLIVAAFVGGYGYGRWYAVADAVQASVAKSSEALAASADILPNLPMGAIQISPEKQQLIGVKYGLPSLGPSIKTVRAVGKIATDERRIAHVHTRVEGWIDPAAEPVLRWWTTSISTVLSMCSCST